MTWTDKTVSDTAYTNKIPSDVGLELWSVSVLPWQLSLPWSQAFTDWVNKVPN